MCRSGSSSIAPVGVRVAIVRRTKVGVSQFLLKIKIIKNTVIMKLVQVDVEKNILRLVKIADLVV